MNRRSFFQTVSMTAVAAAFGQYSQWMDIDRKSEEFFAMLFTENGEQQPIKIKKILCLN